MLEMNFPYYFFIILIIKNLILIFKVYTDVIGEGVWKKCFKVPGVRLPPNYYFGVSAATGDLSGIFF